MFTGWNDTLAGYYGISVLDNWDRLKAGPVLARHNRLYAKPMNEVKDLRPPRPEDYSFKTHYFLSKLLYLAKYSRNLKAIIKELLLDPDSVVKGMLTNVTAVYDMSKRYNFKFIFYLQPSIYDTKKILTPYEKLTASTTIYNTLFPEYTAAIYGRYRKEISGLASQEGFYFFDGDEAISGEARTVFADDVHFGDRGNRLIAEDLARIIGKMLSGLK